MLLVLKTLLGVFWTLLKVPVYILLAFAALFGMACLLQAALLVARKGYRIPRVSHAPKKRPGVLRRLFWDAPRRIVEDWLTRDPDYFTYQGLHIFCGEQGSGKTMALVEMMMRIQHEFPKCKCITNLGYAHEDDQLTDWRQLLTYSNGQAGVMVGIDELQNWFASGLNTLPPGMLEVVTQNRKNRRIILGTSQVFTRLAKGLREQATLVYMPITIAGAVTWVRVRKPVLDSEGNVVKFNNRGSYFFVHSKELREAYDTYKVIHTLAKEGFKEQPPEVVNKTVVNLQNVKLR